MKPEIRFKEFTNAWEQHGILSSNRDSGHAESSPYSDFEKNSMPSVWKKVRLGDILKNHSFKKLIVVPVQNGKYVVIQQGNIPIAGYSDLAHFDDYDSVVLFGDHTLSLYKPNKPFALASDGVKIFYSEFTTGNYLYYLLENNLPENEGYKRYSQILKNQEVYIVENKTEQNKISKLFASLDSLIALHQRKCDKLKNVKKSLLEKMFPAEGKDVPEIRFKEFTDAWEQRKFGDCVLIQRGGSPRPIENYITKGEEGINWVKIGDVSADSRYITCTKEKIIPEGEKFSRRVQIGDLILSNSMSFGRPYIMAVDGCIHDGWLLIRDNNNLFYQEYLLQLLSSNYMYSQYRSLASGGVVNNLNSDLVQSITALIPNKEEQSKLGAFFRNLDNLIALHQRKCEKLKNIKKALLEKMFC